MKCIEQKLQDLSGFGGIRSLLQPVLQSHQRTFDGASELLNLLSELHQRSSHPHHCGVDIDELGAEVDEIGVITVDQVDELVVEGRQVALELGSKSFEGNECPELRNVGFGVEIRREEELGLEP